MNMLGTLFVDARNLSKIANEDHKFLDMLEITEETDSYITLRMKSVVKLSEGWAPVHNWSESIKVSELGPDNDIKFGLSRYLKNDRYVSGAVWVPITENVVEFMDLLQEDKEKDFNIQKELATYLYESNVSNINLMLEPLGKFL